MENEKMLPPGSPSEKQQSWGVFISIFVILGMIILGAFYAWGNRIAQQNALTTPSSVTQQI